MIYPEVQLELRVGEGSIGIVANAFDAGIGTQGLPAADVTAARVTGPMKVLRREKCTESAKSG